MQLDAALTLDYVKLNGITLENGPLTIKDTVEVAGAVTLLDDTVTNTGGTLQVDDSSDADAERHRDHRRHHQ